MYVIQCQFDKEVWVEAVTYTGHLMNKLPSASIDGKTPIEVWTGKLATYYNSYIYFIALLSSMSRKIANSIYGQRKSCFWALAVESIFK